MDNLASLVAFDLPTKRGNLKASMAAAHATSADLWKVPRQSIHILPDANTRDYTTPETIEHIDSLRQSMLENGFYNHKPLAVLVLQCDSDEQPKIVVWDGHCRLMGYDLAVADGMPEQPIPCVALSKDINSLDLTFTQVKSNTGLRFTPLELGIQCARALRGGATEDDILARTGFSRAYLRELVRLVESPEARRLVAAGTVSSTLAREVLKTDGEKADTILEEAGKIAAQAGKKTVTAKHVKAARQKAPEASTTQTYDFVGHMRAHIEASSLLLGPGLRAEETSQKIQADLAQLDDDPSNIDLWLRIASAALDGAWRSNPAADASSVVSTLQAQLAQRTAAARAEIKKRNKEARNA